MIRKAVSSDESNIIRFDIVPIVPIAQPQVPFVRSFLYIHIVLVSSRPVGHPAAPFGCRQVMSPG